ncbi:GNAT family N-acetyltransferase [Tessaracoccus sp. G1721]
MTRLSLEQIWPPYALRITAGDLTLAVVREGDLPELVELVLDGIHDPAQMPFLYPWTDAAAGELPANYVRYFGRTVAGQTPGAVNLQLVVRRAGEVVGIQAVEGESFSVTRTLETGSWLARRFHGHGIGTRMRRAVCAFAFDHLGAERITSSAFLDNPASLAVSRKVGYLPNGRQWVSRRGEAAEQQRLLLTPGTFVRGDPVQVNGSAELRAFLGVA